MARARRTGIRRGRSRRTHAHAWTRRSRRWANCLLRRSRAIGDSRPRRCATPKRPLISARPLSEDARARLDAEIETMGELFVETVARNRGLSPQAVRNTEAATYLGA